MKIADIISYLETLAPPSLQENYDNAGLLTGDPETEITGALVCLDSIEEIIDEAISLNCNLIIAHHPIIFSGLKKINGKNYIERTIIKAIKNDIAIYAIHTNLDNVRMGVNEMIARKLELLDCKILAPKKGLLKKLVTFIPTNHAEKLRQALFEAGAGHIGHYDHCSFSLEGTGSFRGDDASAPYVGEKGEEHHEPETRIEVIYPAVSERQILFALRQNHPYEEIAYDIYLLENKHPEIGAGLIGRLKHPTDEFLFLRFVKSAMQTPSIRYTAFKGKNVERVAICGGSGSFLLQDAIAAGADVFITADFKYHQFFDADNRIVIADIGHYESEQFTIELITGLLQKKFPNFALHFTKINTNPINYL